jgi:hypothetical protein
MEKLERKARAEEHKRKDAEYGESSFLDECES